MPKVLNLKNIKYKVPEGAIYIGRKNLRYNLEEHPLHNPYHIGQDGTRAEVIEKYRKYIEEHPELQDEIEKLRGHDLICWCKPLACHGDILLELANQEEELYQWPLFEISITPMEVCNSRSIKND